MWMCGACHQYLGCWDPWLQHPSAPCTAPLCDRESTGTRSCIGCASRHCIIPVNWLGMHRSPLPFPAPVVPSPPPAALPLLETDGHVAGGGPQHHGVDRGGDRVFHFRRATVRGPLPFRCHPRALQTLGLSPTPPPTVRLLSRAPCSIVLHLCAAYGWVVTSGCVEEWGVAWCVWVSLRGQSSVKFSGCLLPRVSFTRMSCLGACVLPLPPLPQA